MNDIHQGIFFVSIFADETIVEKLIKVQK